ncbi:unnamed protein product [Effrenium voratum]|uniref:PDZ domain-containing protein n=1 Tax=Effrenium voratum TaxID=2562239 RepID=A0AA36IY93_9DINO|nr:unnamed protein product [Effrenium voratum]
MPVHEIEEKELQADEDVGSLGFGFVELPPTRQAPVVIKTVKPDSWADKAGIKHGSELVQVDGKDACSLSSEDFKAVLKKRPLSMKLREPSAEAWKQVIHLRDMNAVLASQKVDLQNKLILEFDRAKSWLEICTEREKENSKRRQTQVENLQKTSEEKVQECELQEAEITKLKAELEACQLQLSEAAKNGTAEAELARRQEALGQLQKQGEDQARQEAELAAFREEKSQLATEKSKLEEMQLLLAAQKEEVQKQEAQLAEKNCLLQESLAKESAAPVNGALQMEAETAELQSTKEALQRCEAELQETLAKAAGPANGELQMEAQAAELQSTKEALQRCEAQLSEKDGLLKSDLAKQETWQLREVELQQQLTSEEAQVKEQEQRQAELVASEVAEFQQQLADQRQEVQSTKEALQHCEAQLSAAAQQAPALEGVEVELSRARVALNAAQPELQTLLAQLAAPDLFKDPVASPRRPVAPPPAPAPAPAETAESDEEMF